MTREVRLVGAGGFGREAADVVEAHAQHEPDGWRIAGVYDDGITDLHRTRLADRGIAYLGPFPEHPPHKGAALVVAIGSPQARRRVVDRARATGWSFPSFIHPDAVVGSVVRIGEGVVVCGGVQVSTNVQLGDHVHVNPNATLGHDAVLEEFVSVNPAAVISGEVRIGAGALVGAASTVLQGLTVGPEATVGAMACVVREVPRGSIVKGVPAR